LRGRIDREEDGFAAEEELVDGELELRRNILRVDHGEGVESGGIDTKQSGHNVGHLRGVERAVGGLSYSAKAEYPVITAVHDRDAPTQDGRHRSYPPTNSSLRYPCAYSNAVRSP